jgi:hypothetical protein
MKDLFNFFDLFDFVVNGEVVWYADWQNAMSVICGNLCNLWTIDNGRLSP